MIYLCQLYCEKQLNFGKCTWNKHITPLVSNVKDLKNNNNQSIKL